MQVHRGACLWGQVQTTKAMTKWHQDWKELSWIRLQTYRGDCLWSRVWAVKAIVKWHDETRMHQETMEALYQAMFRWARSSLSAGFATWRLKAQNERVNETLLIAVQHFRYASIFVVLDHWRDAVQQLGQRESHHVQNNYKASSHHRYSVLRLAFDSWKEVWLEDQVIPEQLVDQSGPTCLLAQACHPYGMFSVSITGTMYGKQDRALYYIVEVNFEGRPAYELNKRYRDFDVLNSTLRERFANVLRVGPGSPSFPPKKPFTKLNPEFYESRASDLHQFIQDLVKHREVAASGELCEFLEFQNYFYQ